MFLAVFFGAIFLLWYWRYRVYMQHDFVNSYPGVIRWMVFQPLVAWIAFCFFGAPVVLAILGFSYTSTVAQVISAVTAFYSLAMFFMNAGPLFVISAQCAFLNRHGDMMQGLPAADGVHRWEPDKIVHPVLYRVWHSQGGRRFHAQLDALEEKISSRKGSDEASQGASLEPVAMDHE